MTKLRLGQKVSWIVSAIQQMYLGACAKGALVSICKKNENWRKIVRFLFVYGGRNTNS